jgi:hypothetical protein
MVAFTTKFHDVATTTANFCLKQMAQDSACFTASTDVMNFFYKIVRETEIKWARQTSISSTTHLYMHPMIRITRASYCRVNTARLNTITFRSPERDPIPTHSPSLSCICIQLVSFRDSHCYSAEQQADIVSHARTVGEPVFSDVDRQYLHRMLLPIQRR